MAHALIAFCLVVAGFAASPAQAQWLRAESPRFVVYSDGGEADLRLYVEQLEIFESLLRAIHGLPLQAAAPRKLDLYLLRNTASLRRVRPGASDTLGGFYAGSAENIFAIAVHRRERGRRADNQNYIMLHEYVHHFMLQHFPYGYPGWLVEGYAEYFMTARITPQAVEVGHLNPMRAAWLPARGGLPPETILRGSPWGFDDSEDVARFYAQSWLLTHYMMSDPGRSQQLRAYMRAVGEDGTDPVQAMVDATGLSIEALQRELRDYRRVSLQVTTYPVDRIPTPAVTVTRLSPAANALLLESVRLSAYDRRAERPELLARIRRAAARFPDDSLARLTLARAEIRLGDKALGEDLLSDLLVAEPDNVAALYLMASSLMETAREDDDADVDALNAQARRHLARAYQADPGHYQTLLAIARNGGGVRSRSENVLEAYLAALESAPQVDQIRMETALALLNNDRVDYAESILQPLLQNPHRPQMAKAARELLAAARAGYAVSFDFDDDEQDDEDEDEDAPDGGDIRR